MSRFDRPNLGEAPDREGIPVSPEKKDEAAVKVDTAASATHGQLTEAAMINTEASKTDLRVETTETPPARSLTAAEVREAFSALAGLSVGRRPLAKEEGK